MIGYRSYQKEGSGWYTPIGYYRLGTSAPRDRLRGYRLRYRKKFLKPVEGPATTPLSVFSLLPIEWCQGINSFDSIFTGWIQEFITNNIELVEWLNEFGQNNLTQMEWLQLLSSFVDNPTEWVQELGLNLDLDIDWLSVLTNLETLLTEWTNQVKFTLPFFNCWYIVDLEKLTIDDLENAGIGECLSQSIEWLNEAKGNLSLPVEFTGEGEVVTAVGQIPIEWLLELSLNNGLGTEYNSEFLPSFESPIGWNQDLSLNKAILAEWLQNIAQNTNLNVEWGGSTTLSVFKSVNVDWLNLVASNIKLPISWLQEIGKFDLLPVGYESGFSNVHQSPIDWNNIVAVGQILPIDWTSLTTAFETNKLLPIDWITLTSAFETNNRLPIEWQAITSAKIGGIWILDRRGIIWVLDKRGKRRIIT